mgnify:CR=1 FL=1
MIFKYFSILLFKCIESWTPTGCCSMYWVWYHPYQWSFVCQYERSNVGVDSHDHDLFSCKLESQGWKTGTNETWIRETPAALRALRLHFTQILFENVTQAKIPSPSYSRRSPPSSFSDLTRTLTLILSGGLYKISII